MGVSGEQKKRCGCGRWEGSGDVTGRGERWSGRQMSVGGEGSKRRW
jgi:hypothetical protein